MSELAAGAAVAQAGDGLAASGRAFVLVGRWVQATERSRAARGGSSGGRWVAERRLGRQRQRVVRGLGCPACSGP